MRTLHTGRIVKDADDVIRLVQANGVNLQDEEMRDLFLKHEQRNSMKKSAVSARKTGEKLELPDWSGMDDSSSRLTKEEALRLSQEYAASGAGLHRRRKRGEAVMEFKL